MGFLVDAQDYVVLELQTAGLANVTADIRNLNTPGVLVDPPVIVTMSAGGNTARLRFSIVVVAAPPAANPAVRNILDRVDTILSIQGLNITGGQPAVINAGQAELPCYTLTAELAFTRS